MTDRWAPSLLALAEPDQLLGAEDTHYDGPSAGTELFWTHGDHQNTIDEVLNGAFGKAAMTEYDGFGKQSLAT